MGDLSTTAFVGADSYQQLSRSMYLNVKLALDSDD